ncbi:ATP-dependent protease [Candidatus Tenderia electrophaga]|jgi:magnesium chelatase family protein|uniref:ATP-dependent protease n=1 Tax=Candidatus Tenderia electrophaga TaxID=1748243 RepID=A0A0S2TGY2_9GAMM|nr:ATP-dependent protease [Candidatus Tenderia electrophaga]
MSLAVVYSRAGAGIDAPLVTVEVHLANGLPSLNIVGLPEAAVKESKDRVRGALLTSQFDFPARRITINLAPADLPKEGGRFDLPIALGILAASGQIPKDRLSDYEFVGELALSGELRAIRGVLPVAAHCGRAGRALLLPADNGAEATLAGDTIILATDHLLKVCAHLNGNEVLAPLPRVDVPAQPTQHADISDVRGQHHAKRALEIAAAGGHSLLMMGPPGTGKTMLASRLPGLLPTMTEQEALETAAIQSISQGGFDPANWRQRPFRAPHHTASGVALVGGGGNPRPGEISLAHNGVMFLDELPEYDRRVLEVLREPLESGKVTISRAARQAEFPARFQLIAAMNPCPCGYLGDAGGRCRCTADQVQRYRARISGPILDRIDMHIEVPPLPREMLYSDRAGDSEDSATVRRRVEQARALQQQRAGKANHRLGSREIDQYCRLSADNRGLLEQATERLGLSARASHRILRVARSIADLDGSEAIGTAHLSEAISYRRLDRDRH